MFSLLPIPLTLTSALAFALAFTLTLGGGAIEKSYGSYRPDGNGVEKLLGHLKEKSSQIKVVRHQQMAQLISRKSEGLIFKPSGLLEGSYINRDNPQTSPFSTSNSSAQEYVVGVEKLSLWGPKIKLTYGFKDVSQAFFSGKKNSFLMPILTLNLKTNIIQDIFYRRYRHLDDRITKEVDAIELISKIAQKDLLIRGLLDFSTLLEQRQELALQRELCDKTKVQSKKLASKRARNSISKRDYYLNLRELTICQANVGQIKKSFFEKQEKFESTYNFSFESFNHLNATILFKELEKNYFSNKKSTYLIDMDKKDEIKSLGLQIASLQSRQEELNALSKSNLSFELRTGAAGINKSSIASSHQDIGKVKYPFVYVGLKLGLPWVDRKAQANALANRYQLQAFKEQKKLALAQNNQRFATLQKTLQSDFSIHKKYQDSTKLSRDILSDARKDFNNGRIDFYTLTEFNKVLIQDQKTLSSFRIQLLVRMVEYLDFYNYFDRYF